MLEYILSLSLFSLYIYIYLYLFTYTHIGFYLSRIILDTQQWNNTPHRSEATDVSELEKMGALPSAWRLRGGSKCWDVDIAGVIKCHPLFSG